MSNGKGTALAITAAAIGVGIYLFSGKASATEPPAVEPPKPPSGQPPGGQPPGEAPPPMANVPVSSAFTFLYGAKPTSFGSVNWKSADVVGIRHSMIEMAKTTAKSKVIAGQGSADGQYSLREDILYSNGQVGKMVIWSGIYTFAELIPGGVPKLESGPKV